MTIVREPPTIADLAILLMEQDLPRQTYDVAYYETLARDFLAATEEEEEEEDDDTE